MFISSSSVQGSLWGWTNKELPATGITNTNLNSGTYSGFTLAPNGYSYAIPSTTGNNSVLVIEPGTGNNGLTNYTNATCASVAADGSGTKPNFNTKTNATYQTKGILAQDGKIYYIPTINNTSGSYPICILTPNTGTNCTWTFHDVSELGCGGGILGVDGYIYIIPGSNSTKLYRLDISGGTPTIDYSFYDGSGVEPSIVSKNTSQISSGTTIYLPNTTGITIGMRVSLPTAAGNESSGVLSDEDDTVVESIISGGVIVNLAPTVPIASGTTVWFNEFSKILTGNRRRWVSYLNKVYAGSGDVSTDGTSTVYDLERHPNHNLVATLGNLTQGFSGAFITKGSSKIYLAPGVNNQIFIINPEEWSTKGALTSAPGLQLKNITIRSGKSTTPNYNSKKTNAYKKFSGFITGDDDNVYFSIFSSDSFTATMFPVDASYRKTFKLDLSTNTITEIGDSSSIQDFTAPGLFPNGEIVQIRHTGTNTSTIYKKNIVVNTIDNKFKLDSTHLIPLKTYTETLSSRGWSNGTFFPQTGFITFNTPDALGKVILAGKGAISKYGIEFLSVKGFYTGVTNFNKMDDAKLFIPSTIADLPTSDYNVFKNTLV